MRPACAWGGGCWTGSVQRLTSTRSATYQLNKNIITPTIIPTQLQQQTKFTHLTIDIYFDFQKAFNSVNHDIILNKLTHQCGIDGSLLKFFKSYLEERHQRVVIGNKMSNPCRVTSGVPRINVRPYPIYFIP